MWKSISKILDKIGVSSAAGLGVRHAITAIGGALAAKGLIDGGAVEPLTGALMILVGIAWSGFQKYQANRI